MNIELIDENNFLKNDYKSSLIKIAKRILHILKLPKNTELCISIISDVEMRKLNNDYRGIKRTTDVLSFPQDIIHDLNMLGDVVISYDTAIRHSELYEITLHNELKKLLVHSILHLTGYNHKKKKEKIEMFAKEKEILELIKDL